MKVKNFTYLWCYFVLSCMFVIPHMSYSQGNTLACNDNVQISLDATCGGVTLDMLLEGGIPAFSVADSGPEAGFGYGIEVNGISGRTASTAECSLFGVDSGDRGPALTLADFGPMTTMCGTDNPLRPKAEFPWGNFVNETVTFKITELSGGNSCWGTATIELNAKPVINTGGCLAMEMPTNSPSKINLAGNISDDSDDDVELDAEWHQNTVTGEGLNVSNGVEIGEWYADLFMSELPCDHVITWESALKYPVFSPKGEVDWILADLEVFTYTVDGAGVFQATPVTMGQTLPAGKIRFLVKASAANAIGSYKISLDGNCAGTELRFPTVWCAGEPACFMNYEDFADEIANGCYDIELLPEVRTESGDICDRQVINVKYFGKITNHGNPSTVLLLDQTYEILPLTIFDGGLEANDDDDDDDPTPIDPATGSGTGTKIFFPKAFGPLDCGIASADDLDPETIRLAASKTGSGTFAYPYFLDMHDVVDATNEFCVIVHSAVAVDTVDQMTLIDPDDIPNNGNELWVLLPVVKKDIIETKFCEVFKVNAAGEPVVDRNRDGVCDATVFVTDKDGKGVGDPVALGVTDCVVATSPQVELLIPDKFCNLVVSFDDSAPLAACGGGVKIIRNWTVLDWCNSSSIITGVQYIEIRDTEAPKLLEPLDDLIASIEPWTCSAKVKLPVIKASDNCSDLKFAFAPIEGILADGFIIDLWPENNPITVQVAISDECGNTTETSFNIVVVDDVLPVPVCQDNLVVSLTTGGTAKVLAESFDAGSHDAGCGDIDRIEVRRMTGCCSDEDSKLNECVTMSDTIFNKFGAIDTIMVLDGEDAFGPFVKFCCEDAGQTIMVQVRFYDAAGNFNDCMVEATIVDKSAASLACQDVTIECTDDLSEVGPALAIAAVCAGASPDLLSETENVDGCGLGTVVREYWIDNDGSEDLTQGDAYCKQTITVVRGDEAIFDPHSIRWPIHYTGELLEGINYECDPEDEDGEDFETFDNELVPMGDVFACSSGDTPEVPVWCNTACGLVGYSLQVDTVVASDACLKLIKRWTVIDWCTWESNGSGVDDENDRGREDFIPVSDWRTTCIDCEEVLGVNFYFAYDGDNVDVDGYYTFDQVIKVVDDSKPTILVDAAYSVSTSGGATSKDDPTECTGSDTVTATAIDSCGGNDSGAALLSWVVRLKKGDSLVATKTFTGASATMGTGEGSPGDVHVIEWIVTDGCGNSSKSETEVTFGDDKAPTPLCISGVTTAFMRSTGTVEIWASDFNIGSFDNCTDITFSMVPSGDTPIQLGADGHDEQLNFTFNCTDLSNFQDFDVYVWDANGNSDFCTVGVLVGGSCNGESEPGAGAMIAGDVATAFGDMVDDTNINVNSAAGQEYPKSRMTDDAGEYSFANNPLTFDYSLTAEKDGEYLNGVSTFDIVLIQKHILNSAVFENAYQFLAADINNSGSISASDLVELRKLILGIYNELPANSSWRFVDASQNFADPTSPWPFNEVLNVNNLANDMMSEDFVAIKVGDVNGDALANGLMRASTRSNGTLELTAENQTLSAGEIVRVAVGANNFENVAGYQFTLNHSGLTLEGVEAGAINATEANIGAKAGQLTMSWSEAEGVSTDEVLFTLVFKANQATDLSSALALNSEITVAEAYAGVNLDRMDVSLAIGNDAAVAAFDLYQNNPNPFGAETSIGFTLPEAGEATLTVFDVAGKTVTKIEGDYTKGYNEIVLNRNQVNVAGVLYYELQSGDFTATKKMIVIE